MRRSASEKIRSAMTNRPSPPVTSSIESTYSKTPTVPSKGKYFFHTATTTTPGKGCLVSASTTCAFHGPSACAVGGEKLSKSKAQKPETRSRRSEIGFNAEAQKK